VLHTHNHALGKNLSLPRAVSQWAGEGRALITQIHDFAEHNRPANYRKLCAGFGGKVGLSKVLYPHTSRVRPVCLTRSAAARFAHADAAILPNPILLPEGGDAFRPEGERVVVYPTRGIARKNPGEAILYAALTGETVVFTSAPAGGGELAAYETWRTFSEESGFSVIFDASSKFQRPVYDFLLGADECLTTSVEEGFGMAFLEPWAAGKTLFGRDLPEVTADFREAGLVLNDLYLRWDIPHECLDAVLVNEEVRRRLTDQWSAYEIPLTTESLNAALAAVWSPEGADFGQLAPAMQRSVIAKACQLGLKPPPRPIASPDVLHTNQSALKKNFSLHSYGERLISLYSDVLHAPATAPEFLNAPDLLSRVLTPSPAPRKPKVEK
jgi:hypothetical protein